MKRLFSIGLAISAVIFLPRPACAAVDFVVDVMPASILANLSADEFEVTSTEWGKEKPSVFSTVPNIAAGVDIGMTPGYLDLKVGTGILLNYNIHSSLFMGTAGWYQEIKPSIYFGPHVGLTYFPSPEWWGDIPLEFDSSTGYLLGLHLSAGDKISYLLSVDYLSMQFDVTSVGPGVTTSKDSVNMSGITAQFGIRVQF